ncbi:MAG TPA: radical SAM protein, partial [Polyangiaceae bacterium]|nr:radical SAM protein [Polyangiaceae bacterium]
DLSSWTLFVADALFGMKTHWRRAFLEALARRPTRAKKIWLLIRVDLVEREDLELMARANIAPGFGLESGDPDHLKRIRKAGRLEGYLERMRQVAGWAHELGVPFGANVIVGHPGETEASMRESAAYLADLFLGDTRGTMGFLSVDPFRLYPGSPIDEEREAWERDTGMHVHRYPWWHDGDQDFLAEWVDPSRELDFRTCLRLKRELFDPILRAIPERFAYQGPARDYFMRAVDEQVELASPKRYLHTLGLWHLWSDLVGEGSEPRDDAELAAAARHARLVTMSGKGLSMPMMRAIEEVSRELFVDREHIAESAADVALPLTEDGASTISAMHAYATAFEALALEEGDELVELGSGTGYGAALAAEVVGPRGGVKTIEIEPSLAAQATDNLRGYPQVSVLTGDAHDVDQWRAATKIYVAFALSQLPPAWIDAMSTGAKLIAPIGAPQQTLTLFEKTPTGMTHRTLEPVAYVADRTTLARRHPTT